MKYILSLFIALWSIAAWGQEGGDGFNPSNPGEPGQRYNLTVNVTPDGAGSTSPSGKQQYALGESVYLSANANNYYHNRRVQGYRQLQSRQSRRSVAGSH